jgi:hypothetical protein
MVPALVISREAGDPPSEGTRLPTLCRRTMADLVLNGEEVGGLAVECVAEGGEGRETDCASAAVLEDREVHDRDVNALGQLGQGHFSFLEESVEVDDHLVGRVLLWHLRWFLRRLHGVAGLARRLLPG